MSGINSFQQKPALENYQLKNFTMNETAKRSLKLKPLVSIVIDSYNYAQFLTAAIDSALNQTYSNVEVIVVDDGSTDDSREVIESYGEKIKAVFKLNGGQASAMNRGFEAAAGELIYFLDSDDIALPDCVEKIVSLYQSADDDAAFQFKLQIIDKNGNATSAMMPDIERLQSGEARRLLEQKGFYVFPPTSGNVFSRSLLEKFMPIPEEDYRVCADIYLCTMAGLVGTVKDAGETLAQFRLHGGNNGASLDVRAAPPIEDYVEMMIYEAWARKKSKSLCENFLNKPVGGNSELRYVFFSSARQKLSKDGARKLSRFEMLKKFWKELRQAGNAPANKKIPVMLYLAAIALLPKKMVSSLVRLTFVNSPKSLDFLVKKAFSR